ncbi:hypothetical protein TNIN_108551 [Trichonephila inaurata madagascariensis]|uniref:Uncharacterized protein n=1 Tax=Trichonephila inaurata madagascariensis TaxID=2747483 RepID=A0A8X6YB08_9ARAC|nr:hypothetical protein TNIN_108551 [Trichonephila inaurata madagascariensis]
MEWKHPSSPVRKKFKTTPSAGKVLLTVFWDAQGVLLLDFLEQDSFCVESATNAMKEEIFGHRGWESFAIPASSKSTSPVLGLIWDENFNTSKMDAESLKFDEKEKITKRKVLLLVSRVFG